MLRQLGACCPAAPEEFLSKASRDFTRTDGTGKLPLLVQVGRSLTASHKRCHSPCRPVPCSLSDG